MLHAIHTYTQLMYNVVAIHSVHINNNNNDNDNDNHDHHDHHDHTNNNNNDVINECCRFEEETLIYLTFDSSVIVKVEL